MPFPEARATGGLSMVLGDGAFVRVILDALVDFLHRFASPTGARGSILMMSGGLVVLGFLFLTFTFRSAIVGDLAPVANARAPIPRVHLPPTGRVLVSPVQAPLHDMDAFGDGRILGRKPRSGIDAHFEALEQLGCVLRMTEGGATRKRVRLYRCPSCADGEGAHGCERERGFLAGAFEAMTGQLAKVEEVECASRGAAYCEFEVRHAVLLRVVR